MKLNWNGTILVNDSECETLDLSSLNGSVNIRLLPKGTAHRVRVTDDTTNSVESTNDVTEYRIKVKSYMTKKATPDFDFMQRWNNNVPMPLMVMTGTKEKETKGMVYMKLHGDLYAEVIQTCMCCGKPITNPISKYFGMGPVCGGHNYTSPFDSEDDLKQAVAEYKKKLLNITWEGWIVKSAVTEEVEV